MEIEYEEMREIVFRYCNQNYEAGTEPIGLRRTIELMCAYVRGSHYGNEKQITVDKVSYLYSDKELFDKFSALLSPYKRLKIL